MRHCCTDLVIVFLAAIYFKCVKSECPKNLIGECKLPMECDTIPFLKQKHGIIWQQKRQLDEIGCGTFEGLFQLICCPFPENQECVTTSGVKGVCKEARNCTALQNFTYEASNLRTPSCTGMDDVCCPATPPVQITTSPPTLPIIPTLPVNQTTSITTSTSSSKLFSGECEAASRPPDSDSGCCGVNVVSTTIRITGGTETEINQYPWLALLEYRVSGTLLTKCSGSLISGRYVLTAAHCVHRNITSPPESVRLGEHDIRKDVDCDLDDTKKCNNGSISIPIMEINIHELYLPIISFYNDIALLRLDSIVMFSEFISPICLPAPNAAVPDELIIAGWGATDTGYSSPVKMHARIPFLNLATCNSKYYPGLRLQHLQMCAGGEIGKDTCKGDSGAPLMHFTGTRYEVLGIVSFGKRRCKLGHPSVFTKVTEYVHWISHNMRK